MTDPSQQPVGLVRLGYGLGYIAHLHVAHLQRPTHGRNGELPAPDFRPTSNDQATTTSTGGRAPIFSPERHAPTGDTQDFRATTAGQPDDSSSTAAASRGAQSSGSTRAALAAKLIAWYQPASRNRSSS